MEVIPGEVVEQAAPLHVVRHLERREVDGGWVDGRVEGGR